MSSITTSFTGSTPENYDRYLGPVLFEFSAVDLAARAAACLVGPGEVLEIACGTGISTRHLAGAVPAGGQIHATDLNEAMLAHASKVNGALAGVSYSQADALDLPFQDEVFDVVTCQFGIMFFPDKAKGLGEMTRVLKPGGTLLVNVWDSMQANPATEVGCGTINGFFESDPLRFMETPFGLSDVDVVRALIEGAGCPEIEVARVVEDVEVADHEGLARGFVSGNPTILEIEQRATVDAETIVAAVAEAFTEAFGPAPARIPFCEIVFQARKP